MEEVYLIHSNSSLARSLVLVLVVLFHLVVALRSATRSPSGLTRYGFCEVKKGAFFAIRRRAAANMAMWLEVLDMTPLNHH